MTTPKPPTGIGCYCGCGQSTNNYFVAGHDAHAHKYLNQLAYGPSDVTARRVVANGYGPDAKNLKDEHAAWEESRRRFD